MTLEHRMDMAAQLTREMGYEEFQTLPGQMGPEAYENLMNGTEREIPDGPERSWDEGRMREPGEYRGLMSRMRGGPER